jgi:2-polyprenyl-3-methyl-5-hydroxy-6-metoxy-1,4-benzoquinol methylase
MKTSSLVSDQYSRYPYPEPGDDIPTWLKSFNYDLYHPGVYAALFWPEGRPRADLNILVAGCGSMQAAVVAFQNPECRVTGIDFVEASIAHEQQLRERHNLQNLTLEAMNLFDVANLGQQFDLILCTGVLHHLADPGQGVRALSSALEPSHGALIAMLYGRLGRSGIYPLQDAFRRLQVPQSPEGVRMVRSIIKRLPAYHPGRRYFEYSPEMESDAAVVDTFLHPQDTAFCVPEVLDLIEASGLKFQCWLDNGMYNYGWDSLTAEIPDRERWSIVESLAWNITTHNFIACRPERDKRSAVDFSADGWLTCFPQGRPTIQASLLEDGKFTRDGFEFSLSPMEAVLLAEANGRRTVVDILRHKLLGALPGEERRAFARRFYERMWRLGHMFFSSVPVKARSRPSDGS